MHSKVLLIISLALSVFLVSAIAGPLSATPSYDSPYVWDEPVRVKRVAKPKRKQPPKINGKLERKPLLTLKWELLSRGTGNVGDRIDHTRPVKTGDFIKLAVTPNQDGFLYIIHQSKDVTGKIIDQPHLIFPDPRTNNGRNDVKKDERYFVPAYCPEFDDPLDCWWEITPPDGSEHLTVIFSRNEITSLPSKADEVGAWIDQRSIDEIRDERGRVIKRSDKIIRTRSEESDGVYVQNVNPNDNEEIFETIDLAHLTPQGFEEDQGVRTRALFTKRRSDAVRVVVLKDDEPVDPGRDFKSGEEIQIEFRSNFAGYLYVLNVTPGGQKRLLFPCQRNADNRVAPWTDNVLPSKRHGMIFDEEKGAEVLMVVVSSARIGYLEDALSKCCPSPGARDCCESFICDLGDSASLAAAELAGDFSGAQPSGIVAGSVDESRTGARTRGVKLAQGRDSKKIATYVAIEDKQGNRLDPSKPAVFYIRLKHI